MSLNRLMLRALACVALQKQDDDAVSPTMADDRVFDSRLDPMVFRQFENEDGSFTPMPGITVYTDDDDGTLLNRGSGDGPYQRVVDLRVEIVIGSFDTEIIDEVQQLMLALPMTDAQLEARLDLFEAQVKWALLSLVNRPYTNAFREFVIRIEKISSHASRDETGNNKFASRRMHFACVINDDCSPQWEFAEPGGINPKLIPFADRLDKFPAPWVRPMLQAMTLQPSMTGVLNVLAKTNNPSTFLPLLRRIGFTVDAIGPEADPNLLAAQGKTQGPDGRIEVQQTLELP